MEKQCFKCGQQKPLVDFYRHAKMADGRLNKCKACTKRDVRQNYAGNRDHYRAYEARRSSLDHRVAARKLYRAAHVEQQVRLVGQWRRRHPEKARAHCAVNDAVRSGKIIKPLCCEICQSHQSHKKLHGHHEDYTQRLWVAWLCERCHHLVHNGIVTLGRFHLERAG